ncbi:MAG: vitamin B12-dependent ribonucleotide reductase [bacterium]|nr:vitamin B12-dependent ribonucleotide reductase [bacterium]
MELSVNARRVLEKRYLKKDEEGKPIESAEDMFWRVAENVAGADKNYDPETDVPKRAEEFYQLMTNLDFLPNSPTLMNAGRELQQLSACFVLPVEDSMDSIFETVKNTALIHKSGGGTGFSFSRLRPKDSPVKTTKGVSSGPISFMTVFDAATETIKQGGTRRGANMGILRVDHPDILDFICCKDTDHKLNNFNISVGLTKPFMEALENDSEYDLIDPHSKNKVKGLSASEIFDLIIKHAHKNGEPGIIFLDRMNETNPTPQIGEIESTNPCGEQPLLPYESCNLGSINLSRMVTDNKIDYEKLSKVVESAVRFLDNVIEMNNYPLEIISKMTRGNRKIGLGIMGFADMLIQLGIAYNSEKGLKTAEDVMKFIRDKARETSAQLARERYPFPNFKGSIYDDGKSPQLRNATTTTIAPTGTIGIIANCSSGIEPLFGICFMRKVMDKNELIEVNPYFEKIAREENFYSEDLMRQIAEKGTLHGIKDIPARIQKIFCTAHDITPEWHIKMQAAFQKYTDNAVSKTVNFPNKASCEDVRQVFLLAYKNGCKGVTIYRDGSRDEQVLYLGLGKKEKKETHMPRPRPLMTKGITQKITTGCGNLYITINEDEVGPCEVFSQMGKSGGCAASQSEAVSRLTSLALRSGIDPEIIIKQLKGIRCPSPLWQKGGMVLSCPDAISKAIERYLTNGSGTESLKKTTMTKASAGIYPECPECGDLLELVEGCAVCKACGYSKCW